MEYYSKWNEWKAKYPSLNNKDVISWVYDKCEQFMRKGKDASKFQIQVYIKYFDQYCQYYHVSNPSELIKDERDERNAKVMKYLNFLLKGDLEEISKLGFKIKDSNGNPKRPSEVSIINQIQGKVKSFYSNRGANISVGIESKSSGANKNEINLKKSTIKAIQNKLESNTYRLICKFQSQTGLRIDDILNTLTNGKYHIEEYEMNENKKYYFIRNFETMKEKVTINFMFFTDELGALIKATYPNQKITELDLTTLFMTRGRKDKKTKEFIDGSKTRINQNDYLKRVKAIGKDLGITENIKTHSFRKYFSSQMRKCKEVESELKEHLTGHKGQNLSQSYANNLRDIEWVFDEWNKLQNFICVDCITVDNTSKLVNEHKIKIEELERQNQGLVGQIVDMKEMMMKMYDQLEMRYEKDESVIKWKKEHNIKEVPKND